MPTQPANAGEPLAPASPDSRSLLQALVEAVPLAIVALDAEGRVTSWNQGATRMFGWTEAEVLGQPIPIVPPDKAEESRAIRQLSLHGETVANLELRRRTKNGDPIDVSLSNAPLRGTDGQIYGVVGVMADITEQKQKDKALRESEELFRSLSASTPLGIFLTDATGNCLYSNPQCRTIFGTTMMETLGTGWMKRIHPEDEARVRAEWEAGIRARRSQSTEFRLRLPDVGLIWVHLRTSPMLTEAGAWRGQVATVENITQRKSAEASLVETNRRLEKVLAELQATQSQIVQQERLSALGTMASGIAHDFNNALAAILGLSELLLNRPEVLADGEKTVRYLTMMNTAAKDAGDVVNRLREFYRHREVGEVFAPVEVNQLVRQAVELTQPKWQAQAQASGRTIQVRTDLAPGAALVAGNAAELREALTNLIINAVDAMPQGGTITLRTYPAGSNVAIAVTDTGTGMTEETRRRCLEPFFSTKGTSGTGLGLSMVYGTIQRHQGDISIDTAPGRGTTFTIKLPATTAPDVSTTPPPVTPTVRTARVLLVDDEKDIRTVVAALLESDGHTVVTAPDGEKGLEEFRRGQFDVVIVDRAMPGLSGDQVADAIKSIAPTQPIILLTGFGALMTSMGEVPPGVDLVLGKPVTLAALHEALAKVIAPAQNR